MASSFKQIAPETPVSLSTDSSAIAKEAVALEAGRAAKTLKRSHSDAMGSPGTPVDPYLQSMASSPKLARLDAQQHQMQDQATAADAVAALLDGGRIKDDAMHPGINDTAGYRVLTELSADNMVPPPSHHHVQDDHQDQDNNDAPDNQDSESGAPHDSTSHHHHHHHHHHQDSHDYHDAHETASSHATDNMSMGGGGGVQVTESPTPMEVDGHMNPTMGSAAEQFHDDKSGGSMTYPGAFQSMDGGSLPSTPTRGMTYPEGSIGGSGVKKYKCTDCNAEFTRHHNLKSHQLTHSQDKPFKCDDCDMRFRRLHDLKRHGKLHTGEKPHVCTKCNRKFARGDALVRHTKGVMGCSTARNSLGGHEDGELEGASMMGGDDTTISGMMYSADTVDDDQRRLSLPALKTSQSAASQAASQPRVFAPSGAAPPSSRPFVASPTAVPAPPTTSTPGFAPTATMSDVGPKPLSNGRAPTGQVGDAVNYDLLKALADADMVTRQSRPSVKQPPSVPVFGPDDARSQSSVLAARRPGGVGDNAIAAQFEELLVAQAKKFEERVEALRSQISEQNTQIRAQYAQIQVLEHELSVVKAQYANERSVTTPQM